MADEKKQYDMDKVCLGKRKYSYRRQADEVLTSMKKSGKTTPVTKAYLCRFCGYFHIGNNRKKLRRIQKRQEMRQKKSKLAKNQENDYD